MSDASFKTNQLGVALRMVGVTKQYPGTIAVDHVDFDADVGEVHALMGENGAGKSTLMKMLAGAFSDYSGQIFVSGKEVRLDSPARAKSFGIGMVYQELSLARPISIAENLLVGRLPRKHGVLLDRKRMVSEARRCLSRVGLDIDPMLRVEEISQHEAQLVEIAKVLGNTPCVLVMDEPTSALSREEVGSLFEIIRQLKRGGLTIVYISHHLPEVFEIADRVTVLRDGRKVATRRIDEVTPSTLVQMMVGQSIDEFYAERQSHIGEPVLEVEHLTRYGFFHDISFEAHEGEILGVAGLSGSGRSELARSLCGLDPLDDGRVLMDGVDVAGCTYEEAIDTGLCYLSEDRKNDGLFLRLSVRENLNAALVRRHSRAGVYLGREESGVARRLVEALQIAASSKDAEVNSLSGGNQQKVLLGKWLAAEPRVLILDEPSRGVDVKAKIRIHEAIIGLADEGHSVVLISSDLPELVGLSDRVIVIRDGHLIGGMSKSQLSEESVLLAMNGDLPSWSHGEENAP